jgi:hypothetical protein
VEHSFQSVAIAAGLVIVAIFGLVVVWNLTKSLVKLLLCVAALAVLGFAGWWLLAKQGMVPPPPVPNPPAKSRPA